MKPAATPGKKNRQASAAHDAWSVLNALGLAEAAAARDLETSAAQNLEPSPRTVRTVDEALLNALMDMRVKSREQPCSSRLMGLLSRLEPRVPTRAGVRAVIRKFEEAFGPVEALAPLR